MYRYSEAKRLSPIGGGYIGITLWDLRFSGGDNLKKLWYRNWNSVWSDRTIRGHYLAETILRRGYEYLRENGIEDDLEVRYIMIEDDGIYERWVYAEDLGFYLRYPGPAWIGGLDLGILRNSMELPIWNILYDYPRWVMI